MLMIWPVPDAPAMACYESGGPPARSVATLGGENHHLRVDGLHLRCPTKSSRAPQVPFLSTVRCPMARPQGERFSDAGEAVEADGRLLHARDLAEAVDGLGLAGIIDSMSGDTGSRQRSPPPGVETGPAASVRIAPVGPRCRPSPSSAVGRAP